MVEVAITKVTEILVTHQNKYVIRKKQKQHQHDSCQPKYSLIVIFTINESRRL